MKHMKHRNLFFLFVAFLFALAAQAQPKGGTQMTLQYKAALPTGSFQNTISGNSFRGLQASVLYGVNKNLAVGFGTGFQDFYQKYPRQLYTLSDGGDLSAVRSFSIQSIPLLAQVKWNSAPEAAVQPYVALGVGGNLVSYNDYAGEFSLEQKTKLGFAARPEVGLSIPFKKGGESGFTLGASYNLMPFKSNALSNLNHLGIQAGFSFPLRK